MSRFRRTNNEGSHLTHSWYDSPFLIARLVLHNEECFNDYVGSPPTPCVSSLRFGNDECPHSSGWYYTGWTTTWNRFQKETIWAVVINKMGSEKKNEIRNHPGQSNWSLRNASSTFYQSKIVSRSFLPNELRPFAPNTNDESTMKATNWKKKLFLYCYPPSFSNLKTRIITNQRTITTTAHRIHVSDQSIDL